MPSSPMFASRDLPGETRSVPTRERTRRVRVRRAGREVAGAACRAFWGAAFLM